MPDRDLVAVVRRRWFLAAGGSVGLCGATGGAVLALAAALDGRTVWPAALLGLLLGAVDGLLDTDWRGGPARAVDPASDPEGLWRTVLVLPGRHPLAGRLRRAAAYCRPRFRASGDWQGLAALALALGLILLWRGSAPGIPATPRRDGGGARAAAPATAAGSAAPAGTRAGEAAGEAPGKGGHEEAPPGENGEAQAPPGGPGPGAGPAAGAGELVPVPVVTLPGSFVPGADLRRLEPVVERFLRLRAQREER